MEYPLVELMSTPARDHDRMFVCGLTHRIVVFESQIG